MALLGFFTRRREAFLGGWRKSQVAGRESTSLIATTQWLDNSTDAWVAHSLSHQLT
jgi:hypothetical protein